MLSGPDRDQFAIKRIVDFYESQPTDYAAYFEAAWRYKHRAALWASPRPRWHQYGDRQQSEPEVSADDLGNSGRRRYFAQPREAEVGPVAKLQAMWKSLPAPAAGKCG